jgi:hypothetical protein
MSSAATGAILSRHRRGSGNATLKLWRRLEDFAAAVCYLYELCCGDAPGDQAPLRNLRYAGYGKRPGDFHCFMSWRDSAVDCLI